MSYFLSEHILVEGTTIEMSGPEARHVLLSRRTKVGDNILLQDQTGTRHSCIVTKATKQSLVCTVKERVETPKEIGYHVTLGLALIAEQALDFSLQKATELGVARIVIFKSNNSPLALKHEKLVRWQRIVQEAVKQCERAVVPEVCLSTLEDILKDSLNPVLFADQSGAQTLTHLQADMRKASHITILIGPEGGWSKTELDQFSKEKIKAVKLGPFVLRAETAAIAAISQIVSILS